MKELVLTGFKDFWPKEEENSLYLGPWCFADNHKYKFWDQKNFNLATSLWKTPQDILEASLYIDSLIDRIIPSLSILMNNFHKTSYSNKFWRIYFIVWLVHWLGVCYDRYQRLNYLQIANEKFKVKILNERNYFINNFWDYIKKTTENHYDNLMLMSDIIINGHFNFLSPEILDVPNKVDARKDINKLNIANKALILKKLKGLALQLRKNLQNYTASSLYLGNVYGLSLFDKFYFQLYYDPLFIFKKTTGSSLEAEAVAEGFSRQTFEFDARNEFEEIIKAIILRHIPAALLHLYSRKNDDKPKIKYWIGNDIYYSEEVAWKIAETCENGGKWLSVQHGGGYGQWYSCPIGKNEYDTSDGFITWGWDYKHIYPTKYYPLPSPMLSRLPKHKGNKEQIVYADTMHPAYHYRFHSALKPEEQLKYMENKKAFLIYLQDSVRLHVKYRPYFNDYGTGVVEYICKVLSPHQILKRGCLTNEIKKARLVVIDHLGTTISEAFAMNAPTILFWNPEHFVYCKEAAPYFDGLRRAGILFDSPEAAAKKINEIWDDVQGWWRLLEVQKAKDEFCRQFARTSKNWRKEWLDFLKGLRDNPENSSSSLSRK